ncbi:MAG: hypothetical protein Q8P84_01605 [Deltaproteobacteria bacterium]|nr:hypothetical protein [Deltaproteobacteria bacterium]
MFSGGENNWWKKSVATGEIRGAVMQNRDTPEGALIWPWGEKPGYCTKDDYVPHGEEEICNAAFVRWEGNFLTVKSPDGGFYRFKQLKRVPVSQKGNHALGSDPAINSLLLKEQKEWPNPDACSEFYHDFSIGLAPLAVREVVWQLRFGAGRCFEIPMETISSPKPQPRKKPPQLAQTIPTPPLETRQGLPQLKEICKTELPQNASRLWEESRVPRLVEFENFQGLRCGFLYHQKQKKTPGTHTPEMPISFNTREQIMVLHTQSGPQRFDLLDDYNRIWARHENSDEWMIPPNMSFDGKPHGAYGPIEIRISKSGELIFRYLIPSNDNKDYIYGWAIARRK